MALSPDTAVAVEVRGEETWQDARVKAAELINRKIFIVMVL